MSGTDQIRTVPIEYMTFRMLISKRTKNYYTNQNPIWIHSIK